jgi:hypothetical protein
VSQSNHDFQWAFYKINLLQKMLELRGEKHGPVLSDEEIFERANAEGEVSPSRLPFFQIQKLIVLGQLNELVQLLIDLQASDSCPAVIHRFCTHFLLVLSKVRCPYFNPQPELVVSDAQNAIFSYVNKVVSGYNKPAIVVGLGIHVVAPDVRVKFISSFIAKCVEENTLEDLKESKANFAIISAEEQSRRKARKQNLRLKFIQTIEAGGLDTVAVLLEVIQTLLPPPDYSVKVYNYNQESFGSTGNTSAHDFMGSHLPLVEVLGWLTIRSEHWKESVVVANSICRNLALRHRISDLHDVLNALPEMTVERHRNACLLPEKKEQAFAFEVEFWRVLCDAYDAFSSWQIARMEKRADLNVVLSLYAGAEAGLRRVVDFPTFPLFERAESNDLRETQLAAIRDAIIPQVFFMLHFLHFNSNRFNLSLALADDVADRRRELWKVFERSGLLERFFALLKESSVCLLGQNHQDILGFDAI